MLAVDLAPGTDAVPRKTDAAVHFAWRRHGYILPSFVIALVVCAWFTTWGDWKFFEREQFCGFYDAQALSMLDGRFDVPPAAIGDEAFIRNGKTYGYFGIAPALLRIPLVVAFADMDGRWSRIMMLLGCGINLVCAYLILLLVRGESATTRAQRWLHSLFIVCAGIGSTNIFLAGRSFTYHEAIMWSGAFALLFVWMLLKYCARPNLGALIFAALFAFVSFHSRPAAGAGALLGLCAVGAILMWRSRSAEKSRAKSAVRIVRPRVHAWVAFAAVAVIVSAYFAVNYAKFRTFNGVPLRYYGWYHVVPVRMQITRGHQFHLENIPTTLAAYFGPPGVTLVRQFPWFFLARHVTVIGSPAIDMVDPHSSIPVSMPALTFAAIIGYLPRRDRQSGTVVCARALALALFLGGAVVLMSVGICQRYLHDFYPALIVAAAIGLSRIERSKRFCSLATALTALALVSVALNCAFSLSHQRSTTGAPPEKIKEFRQLQQKVAHLLGG